MAPQGRTKRLCGKELAHKTQYLQKHLGDEVSLLERGISGFYSGAYCFFDIPSF